MVGEGPPPPGDFESLQEFDTLPEQIRDQLAGLLAIEVAGLRLGTLAKEEPASPDAILIAIAIGVMAAPEMALQLLAFLPPRDSLAECLARHALVRPALEYIPEPLLDAFRQVSPFTALLDCPAAGGQDRILALLSSLLALPEVRQAVVMAFARPTLSAAVRNWRTEVLHRFRTGSSGQLQFVLDIYESQLVHHRQEIIDQTGKARETILNPLRDKDNARLEEALAVARWWGPLRDLERTCLDALRNRPYLHYDYRQGVALANLALQLTGE